MRGFDWLCFLNKMLESTLKRLHVKDRRYCGLKLFFLDFHGEFCMMISDKDNHF